MLAAKHLTLLVLAWTLGGTEGLAQTHLATEKSRPLPKGEPPLQRRAGIILRGVSLPTAFSELTKRSGVPIAFSPSAFSNGVRLISCDCLTVSVREALDRLLAGTSFRWLEINGQVTVYRAGDEPRAPDAAEPLATELAPLPGTLTQLGDDQDAGISGVVVDSRSTPISGARVTLRSSRAGAESRTVSTDESGRFRFAAVDSAQVTLEVVAIGYRPLTQVVRAGDSNLRLALSQSAVNLDEVVVTGTPGETQRRAIGHSVAVVDATELTANAPLADLGQLLNSQVTGVVFQPRSGAVGGGQRIRIRGVTSLSLTNEPLLYIDGVRVDNGTRSAAQGGAFISRLSDLNPDDVESIEIIRGPGFRWSMAIGLALTTSPPGGTRPNTRPRPPQFRSPVGTKPSSSSRRCRKANPRWPLSTLFMVVLDSFRSVATIQQRFELKFVKSGGENYS